VFLFRVQSNVPLETQHDTSRCPCATRTRVGHKKRTLYWTPY